MQLISLLIIVFLIALCDGKRETKQEAARRLDSICDEVGKSSLKEFRSMLDQGLDVNTADQEGFSLLFCLISRIRATKDHLETSRITSLIKELISRGVDLSHIDVSKNSCLHHAAIFGTPEIMKLFLEEGVDVNAQDESGNTPYHVLHPVKFQGKESLHEKVELLKKYEPDMTIRNNFGLLAEESLKSKFEYEGPSGIDIYERNAARKEAKKFVKEKYGRPNAKMQKEIFESIRGEL